MWDGFGQKTKRRKQKLLNEKRQARIEEMRATMTMAELSRRREESQGLGFEFRTRLQFISYLVEQYEEEEQSATDDCIVIDRSEDEREEEEDELIETNTVDTLSSDSEDIVVF